MLIASCVLHDLLLGRGSDRRERLRGWASGLRALGLRVRGLGFKVWRSAVEKSLRLT